MGGEERGGERQGCVGGTYKKFGWMCDGPLGVLTKPSVKSGRVDAVPVGFKIGQLCTWSEGTQGVRESWALSRQPGHTGVTKKSIACGSVSGSLKRTAREGPAAGPPWKPHPTVPEHGFSRGFRELIGREVGVPARDSAVRRPKQGSASCGHRRPVCVTGFILDVSPPAAPREWEGIRGPLKLPCVPCPVRLGGLSGVSTDPIPSSPRQR